MVDSDLLDLIGTDEQVGAAKKILGKSFPLTKNMITFLRITYPTAPQIMKSQCYISSIITSFGLGRKTPAHNVYNEQGMNRLVATILDYNSNCVTIMTQNLMSRCKGWSDKMITIDNCKKYFEKINQAKIDHIDTEKPDEFLNKLKKRLKAYRNCMVYAVGHRKVTWDEGTDKKTIKTKVSEFTDKLVNDFDTIMRPMFTAMVANRNEQSNKEIGWTKYASAQNVAYEHLNIDLGT